MPIRAVLFDLFDTLVDLHMEDLPEVEVAGRRIRSTLPALHAAVGEGVALEALALALRDVDRELRIPRAEADRELPTLLRFENTCERLGLRDPGLPERLTQIHMGEIRRRVRHVAHHPAVLADLASDHRLGLCSNFSHTPTALAVLDDAGLDDHFHTRVVSEEVDVRKPATRIFEIALAGLDVAPDEVLHVGDSLRADVGGAHAAGIRSAWITRRIGDPDAHLAAHDGALPTHTIADLAELPALLRSGRLG